MSGDVTDPVSVRLSKLPSPLARIVRALFALNALAHSLRYPGLLLDGQVWIQGWMRIQNGTRVTIGGGTRIKRGVIINGGGTVRVGSGCLLNGCWIGAVTDVVIGDSCLISDCDITDSDFHNLDPARRHLTADKNASRPIEIGSNVWIGAHAMVLKGTQIGDHSVVGAAAVVRGAVPPRVVITGNPATVVKHL